MANPELVRVMDYILNRCDSKSIEAVAAAVVRRRRDLSMFGDNLPDPKKMAKDITGQINMGASIDGMRETVRNMAVRIIRQEAPELNDEQIAELTAAWIPMSTADDQKLRKEMGPWTERYWNAFPEVMRIIIKDYLNGEISEKTFRLKIAASLSFEGR